MLLVFTCIAAASAFAIRALVRHADRHAKKVKLDARFRLRGYPRSGITNS